MAKTIWVSTLQADNSGDGLTYATAKKNLYDETIGNLGACLIATQGDTINLVNDGVHDDVSTTKAALVNNLLGTSWANPGLTIQGTDSDGNPAIATVGVSGSYAGGWQWVQFFGTTDYVLVQGIKFDLTNINGASCAGSPNTFIFKYFDDNKIIKDCEFWFTAGCGLAYSLSNGLTSIFYGDELSSNAGSNLAEITNCLFVNMPFIKIGAAGAGADISFHHNVLIGDVSDYPSGVKLLELGYDGTPTGSERLVYHNTFFLRSYGSEKTPNVVVDGAADVGELTFHSNLIFCECGTSVATLGLSGAIIKGYSGSAAGDPVLMGYDLIVLGSKLTEFYDAGTWAAGASPGISNYQFNKNFQDGLTQTGVDLYPNSNLLTDTDPAGIFNDPASTWDWTPSDSLYTHTLPMDLRPIYGYALGYDSTVPGALPLAPQPTPPDVGGDIEYSAVLDSLPFYRPVLKVDLTVLHRIDRNYIRGHSDARHYLIGHIYDEDVGQVFTLAAAATRVVYLSGVNQARVFMMESDQQVSVNINTATDSMDLVLNEMLIIDNAGVMYFVVENTSSETATIKFSALQ